MAETLEVRDNQAEHRYEIELDGAVAYAEYRPVEGAVILPHTDVPESFEGRGVGSTLARYALDEARAKHLKVIPPVSSSRATWRAIPSTTTSCTRLTGRNWASAAEQSLTGRGVV
jgi:uncharacterized protein